MQNANPGKTSYTPFLLSDHFLWIITKLTNHDWNTKLNMVCVKFHQEIKTQMKPFSIPGRLEKDAFCSIWGVHWKIVTSLPTYALIVRCFLKWFVNFSVTTELVYKNNKMPSSLYNKSNIRKTWQTKMYRVGKKRACFYCPLKLATGE